MKVVYDNTFHDRYFILDDNTIYHCGASINRIGYKTFSINLISDNDVCDLLLEKINDILMDHLAKCCGKSAKTIRKDCERDTWYGPEEIIEYGLVDKIVKPHK